MMPLQGDMLHRGFKHSVMKFKIKRESWMPFKTYLALKNNLVLIRKYEIIGTDFEHFRVAGIHSERGHLGTSFVFRTYLRLQDFSNTYEFLDMFTLKEYFIHLLEEPVGDVTWLRIKQPGTYTIHFDLIPNSFSFE